MRKTANAAEKNDIVLAETARDQLYEVTDIFQTSDVPGCERHAELLFHRHDERDVDDGIPTLDILCRRGIGDIERRVIEDIPKDGCQLLVDLGSRHRVSPARLSFREGDCSSTKTLRGT